jgi:hypothetical protein
MIAIIDDGVHENYFRHCIVEDLEVYPNFVVQKRKSPFSNAISHGTACAAIIRHFAPDAEIISIKILNSETGKCKPEELIAALHWCASHRIKQCNLSLGSVACKDFDMLYEHLQQMSNSKMLIIAAHSNSGKFTLPANLPGVIGVRLLETLPENTIHITEHIATGLNLSANIDLSVINDTTIPSRTFAKSNSYITAALSGLIYRSGYTSGEPNEALYTKLKSSVPASFNICLGDMPEESKNNDVEIPIIQIAIAGTERPEALFRIEQLIQGRRSNSVSLTEQPVSHLETENL